MKDLLFTPSFVETFGFPQGLKVVNNSTRKEGLGVLALELAPTFSIRVSNNNVITSQTGESLHTIFLPIDQPDRVSFAKVFEFVRSVFPNRLYAYLWHKNGLVSTGNVQCNCEGGSVEHHHIIVLPDWINLMDVQTRLRSYDFENAILTAFGGIEANEHSDYKNYIPSKTFETRIEKTNQPFSTLLNSDNELIKFPAYSIGIGDDRDFLEKTIIIKSNVKGASGFMRAVLTDICDNSNEYERNYRKVISFIRGDTKVTEEIKNKLFNDKYLLSMKLKDWSFKQ